MSLTACLVTRDEERTLEQALGSIVPIADQIIVADTGSRDRTVEIAAKFGAEVHAFSWDDDFAAGRNFAIGRATHPWIFWINPNETLAFSSHHLLRECLSQSDTLAFGVTVQVQPNKDQPNSFTEIGDYRLFQRHPAIKYVGRLHPHFATPLAEMANQLGKRVAPSSAVIRQHAYASQLTEPKLRWALRLLERELHDRPGQLPYLIEWGRTLLQLNDPKGHAVLAKAEAQILAVKSGPVSPAPEVQQLLEYLLTVSQKQSQCRLDRAEVIELTLRWFPSSPPLLWTIASQCFKAGQFGQAARLLERLIALGRTGSYDKSSGFDPHIIGDDAVMNLGACYWRLNDLPRAEACFRQLLTSPTHQHQASQNLIMVKNAQHQEDSSFYSSYLDGTNPEPPDY
jgi:hypothetical protein